MSRDYWNSQPQYPRPQQQSRILHQPPPTPQAPLVAHDSLHQAHRLLATYPFASASPVTHPTRHLSNLSLTAAPPSYYVQQSSFYPQLPSYQQDYPLQYSQYASQLNHINSATRSPQGDQVWDSARSNTVRFLGEQTPQVSYYEPNQWQQDYNPSMYQPTPFAHTVLQHTAPAALYPTPPPPGITTSSSSLAMALGDPMAQSSKKVHRPSDSAAFFNNFLAQQSKVPDLPRTPRRHITVTKEESPDPVALTPSSSRTEPTPQKRKADTTFEAPSLKRKHPQDEVPSVPATSPKFSRSQVNATTPTTTKAKFEVFVEIPSLPKPYRTSSQIFDRPPSQKKRRNGIRNTLDDDLGGFGSDVDGGYPPRSRSSATSKSPIKRGMGDRDERGPLDKFVTLMEDIFEAEDQLPPDAESSDLSPEYFSPFTVDFSRPLLHPTIVKKLTSYIGKVARPSKRLRLSSKEHNLKHPATPRAKDRMAELDPADVSRLLRILERSLKVVEEHDPFHSAASISDSSGTSPTKKSSKSTKPNGLSDRKRSKSKTPKPGDDAVSGDEAVVEGPPDADVETLANALVITRDAVLAADCCLALLGSDRLTKQLYSEELIMSCLVSVKTQLTHIVYPFVEASADLYGRVPPLLKFVTRSPDGANHRRQLAEVFHSVSSVIPRINELICSDYISLSESMIIQAVYIAVGPFFMVDPADGKDRDKKDNVVLNTLGISAIRGLRLDALSLIRSIFANHEDQRPWIIEEILSSLIRLSDTKQKTDLFRLRDGRSIRTVSALLLQLVQTSAHDVGVEASSISKTRAQAAMRQRDSANGDTDGPFLDETDTEEINLYASGLDSATKAAKTIIVFLTQRSGKSKTTKNSNEAEYRAIFDNLISDLLTVVFWPEWPAASILLSIACKYMVSSLDDVKTSTQSDNNAAKTMALDHLGVIAARLRSSIIKFEKAGGTHLKPLDEIVSAVDSKSFRVLSEAHQGISSHLCKRSSSDQACASARELTAVIWGQEIAISLRQIDDTLDNAARDRSALKAFGEKLKRVLGSVWDDSPSDVFELDMSQEDLLQMDRLSEEIGIVQSLRNSLNPIINVVLLALDAPPVFMRTKALKALGQIVTSDPSILSTMNVRRSIESHLLDSSPAVRDAAVELIGKYMIDSPEFAGDYYHKISERIADTGLGVRKRVIKLLKSFYFVTQDRDRRVDICTRLVLRMLDEDETVKDLAIKTVEELWFHDSASTAMQRVKTASPKSDLLAKVTIIMGVSSNFKDRQSPLEDLLHQIMSDKNASETSDLHSRYTEICEALIDGLVDASELPGFTVVNCVRTIHLFTVAHPAVLSAPYAWTLLPYLKNATTVEEQVTSDYLLRIFKASIPHLPSTAVKFGQELQLALQPMILKPSPTAGVQGLQETVACMCVIVKHLTHDFVRLVALLRSCNARLHQSISKPSSQQLSPPELRVLSILIYITALLCEHCDFEQLRGPQEGNLTSEINQIATGPVIEHVYGSLLKLYHKYVDVNLRGRILHCLGFLFRAQPALMTAEPSSRIMDAIFAAKEEEGRARLLRIIQEFLFSEAGKHSAKGKETSKGTKVVSDINMEELVGNTDGFADSGVSSAVVQRYIESILEAVLSLNHQVQSPAVDILSFTVKQGLAHPMQLFPVIVALETSPVTSLSARASVLHSILHVKHTSLLNARYVASARASFKYQQSLGGQSVQGYRMKPTPTALMQRWYSLVREKRAPRQDFLKSLVRVFDIDISSSSQDDVEFARYMAENFAMLEYKTQEEVMTVIKYLTSYLSTTGVQILEILSPSHLLAQLHAPLGPDKAVGGTESSLPVALNNAESLPLPTTELPQDQSARLALMRSSVMIGIIMLLKAHLKSSYGLSEERCSKFVIGKKSALGDKPASKRHDQPISWKRLPYASTPILTDHDMEIQRTKFLEIWSEDGLSAEPIDD